MIHPFFITEKGKLIDQVTLDILSLRQEITKMLNKALDAFKVVK